MPKPWWRSKTYWFNICTGMVALANEMAPVLEHLAAAGYDTEFVSATRAGIALASIGGNLILRAFTVDPVRLY